jgi:signal transduction histidine kinase
VDYAEIPALLLISAIYLGDLRKEFQWKAIFYLFLLNSQWLHLFWITDEFVIEQFIGISATHLPLWLAWVAILIDYLELPVIADTMRRSFVIIRNKIFPEKN